VGKSGRAQTKRVMTKRSGGQAANKSGMPEVLGAAKMCEQNDLAVRGIKRVGGERESGGCTGGGGEQGERRGQWCV